MRIEELHLQNFRGFRELKLTLPPDLAVFIGVNGSGKSSILDSIAILLSQFVADVSVHYESRLYIEEDDIQITSNEVFLSTRVEVDSNNKLWWEVSQDRKMGMQSTKGDLFNYLLERLLNEVIPIHDDERILQINNKNDLILPIIVFYHTDRILIKSSAIKDMSEEERENTYDNNRLIGYQTAFSGNINDFRDFLYWFKEEEEYENEVRLRQDTNLRNPRLEIIRKALETFLEGFPNTQFSDLHIVRVSSSREGGIRRLSKPSLVIKKNGENFKLDQLSNGEKTLLMIVVDIARRLAILNPSITNPSELLEKGTGIILIDEIDLHLHPQWQRIVIPSFRKTFPNCQFIVTTHSPQVLSEVNRENVFILEDSEIVELTPHTFGRDSNSILSEVMGVEKRPVKMQERIDKCFEMIDNDNLEEAKLELQKLSESLGNNDPDMIQAYTLIDFLNRVE
ncbi:AAA family ATPase [Aphanizomenon sp. UHCC 0183]|jgi:predicted ATP-binding protein involved in virulence|uniref:AAA family ATPase n=1 Tax=Aphanizomenon sp. UHCC 0183 TaxID=2590028 RepID=UPI0014463D82|nr:AAA family ATPase [Aphanizomenon sp. UHCC 0183]MTJ28469.1 AAA family ATPase [Aphanizomenon sp. UHCC 0183]